MKSKNAKFITELEIIAKNQSNPLKAEVAQEIWDSDNPITFIQDLLEHSCISGMVSSLIYYTDTHTFFDRHYEEIENLRFEYEEQTGLSLLESANGDLKNWLAWFAFEETAHQIWITCDG